MSKRETKFSENWSEKFPWVIKDKSSIHSARCNICLKTFSIKNGGISDVNQHSKTALHIKNEKQMNSQRTITSCAGPSPGISRPATKDQLLNAEILQALNIVDTNQSFSSSNGDSERFRRMFPDSQIAAKYSQEETKSKYVIQFGLAPYVKEELINEVKKTPYSFKFDESTTSQVKKQYDGYVSFYSTSLGRIVTSYCGSLFVGHCTADDLVDHFFEFVRDLGLDLNLLLALGIDGPNVNKSFRAKLAKELEKRDATQFLDVGTCSIHIANNGFLEGIKCLKSVVNIDQFAIDLHFFFKLSAARREDYREICELTDVTAHYVLKHCQTRWLSLDKVLVRIIEQYANLKEYFLNKLPTLPAFKGKNGINQTERYQRIKSVLKSQTTLAYMSFIVHVCKDFKEFVIPLQSNEPKIHVLYTKSVKLVKDLLSRFVKSEHFMQGTKLLPVKEIVQAIGNKVKLKVFIL